MKKTSRREFIKDITLGTAAIGLSSLTKKTAKGINSKKLKKPANLLFLMTDQQQSKALSIARNSILDTPNLDRIGNEGVYFTNAYTNCPVCVPARSVILTGHSINSIRCTGNSDYSRPDVADLPTFDSILSELGYQTEYYGKWHSPYKFAATYNNYVRQPKQYTNPDKPSEYDAYLDYLNQYCRSRHLEEGELLDKRSKRPYIPDPMDWRYGIPPEKQPLDWDLEGEYGNLDIPPQHTVVAFNAEEALEALNRMKGAPFSLTCSFRPPHPPRVLPEPYYGMYPPSMCDPPDSITDSMENSPYAEEAAVKDHWRYRNADNVRYAISNYYGLVKNIDNWVGVILDRLEEYGLADNTLVVFTSDHGDMLGGHGMCRKSVFYEEAAHIPLLMRFPGVIPAGTIVTNPVSHIDIFPTILDYFGVHGYKSEGHSMRPLINQGRWDGSDFCVSEWPGNKLPNFMVCTEEWKLLYANSVKSKALDALYDLKNDPHELNNLIGKNPRASKYIDIVVWMKMKLVMWLDSINSPFIEGVIMRSPSLRTNKNEEFFIPD